MSINRLSVVPQAESFLPADSGSFVKSVGVGYLQDSRSLLFGEAASAARASLDAPKRKMGRRHSHRPSQRFRSSTVKTSVQRFDGPGCVDHHGDRSAHRTLNTPTFTPVGTSNTRVARRIGVMLRRRHIPTIREHVRRTEWAQKTVSKLGASSAHTSSHDVPRDHIRLRVWRCRRIDAH